MRPTARSQSTLRTPLNHILGAEASVRLLRALAEHPAPLSRSELARHTRLQASGIAKALASLEETGVIELVGSGTRRLAQLRADHPLVPALRALFGSERSRADRVLELLRRAASAVYPVPVAAWVEGSATADHEVVDDSLVVVILTEPASVELAREAFETLLGDLERELDVVIDVRVRTRADLVVATDEERRRLASAIPLVGPPPAALTHDPTTSIGTSPSGMRTHAHSDARALSLASAIAERLRTDPSLVARARDWAQHRLQSASGGERRELREWARILRTMSLPRLRRFLVDPGERATRLRQTLPFLTALTADERHQLFDAAAASAEASETG